MWLVWVALCVFASEPALASTAITLADPTSVNPGWSWNHQVMPDVFGQPYAAVTFKGTYSGTAPSNVDLQFCSDTACATVVQPWGSCSGATIGGGNWSCTFNVQNSWSGTTTWLHVQARDTGVPTTVSAVTTNTLAAGFTILMIGQSNVSHMWEFSGYTQDGNTTSGSCTVTSTMYGNAGMFAGAGFFNNWTNGWAVAGSGIPGGDTVINPYASGSSFTLTPGCATATSTTATINIGFTSLPTPTTVNMRTQGGSVIFPIAAVPSSTESDYGITSVTATYGNMEGPLMIGNIVGAAANAGILEIQYAVGGTASTDWIKPSGGQYSRTAVSGAGLPGFNQDFDIAFWNQGESDAGVNSGPVYLANLHNIEAWVQAYRPPGQILFMLAPLGCPPDNDAPTDTAFDTIRQQQMISIRNDPGVYFGGLSCDLTHLNSLHLGPLAHYRWGKRIAQAILRAKGLSNSGYGPTITGATWTGSTVKVTVQQEAGTALYGKNQGPCTGLTGFRVFSNAVQGTISSTSCPSATEIDLVMSAPLTSPVTFDYMQSSQLANVQNLVYDNMPPSGDTDGLPLQPTIGQLPAIIPAGGRGGKFFLR